MITVEKLFDLASKSYDIEVNRFINIHQQILENTRKYVRKGDIVLDFGCATGTKALNMACHVKKIYGIDISSKMIDAAKIKAGEFNNNNVEFIRSDIFDERFKTEFFDVIFAFNVLHLIKDPKKAVQRIYHLLKPGGLLITESPCLKEKMNFSNRSKFSIACLMMCLGLFPQIKKFTGSEIEELITEENMQIIDSEKLFQGLTCYFTVAKKF